MDNLGVFDAPGRCQPAGAPAGRWHRLDGVLLHEHAAHPLELALHHDRTYEDVASKFLEHFIIISDSLTISVDEACGTTGTGSTTTSFWRRTVHALKLRRDRAYPAAGGHVLVEDGTRQGLPEFASRAEWFLANRKDLIKSLVKSRSRASSAPPLAPVPARQKAAGARPALPARRERVPIAVWRPVVVARV